MKRTKTHTGRKRTKFNYEDLGYSERSQITNIERGIQACIINIKKDAYQIGKLLDKAKTVLPHGRFQTWVESTFGDDLPYSTANLYKNIYQTFEDRPGVVQHIPTKYLSAFTQKRFPDEALMVIKKYVEKKDSIERWQLDQVKEFFDLMKSGTVGGNKFLQQVKQIIKDGEKLTEDELKNQNKHRMNTNARRTMYFGLGDILKKLDSAIDQAHEMAGYFPFNPKNPEHQKVIKLVHKITAKLQKLEKELKGGEGMLKPVSTENGKKYISKN